MKKPRVLLLATGGTISYVGTHSLDLYEYTDHGSERLTIEAMAERLGELGDFAETIPAQFRNVSSSGISPSDWLGLAARIEELCAQHRPDGVVVTHGTASLEETAYFLDLALKVEATVVVVGSQRPFGTRGTDAELNLINAVRVAAAPQARRLGVLVVLNDGIAAAREVTKTSNYRLQTFAVPELGFLGFADPDRIAIYRRPVRRHAPDTAFDVRGRTELPRVDIAYSYAGADGAAIDAFVAAGAGGIVVAGLPAGLPTPAQKNAMEAAIGRGVAIVQSSRAGSGRVLPREVTRSAGIVVADNLNPQKARILTMLALTLGSEPVFLQEIFDTH